MGVAGTLAGVVWGLVKISNREESMSLPQEILDPTERLLQLLQGSDNVSERTMERATRFTTDGSIRMKL